MEKSEIINENKRHENDTGSPEVQIALLTARIKNLTEHLKEHKKDNHSRVGLFKLISRRRKLLGYLHGVDVVRHDSLVERLAIRSSFTKG